jgi:hypothetical protein
MEVKMISPETFCLNFRIQAASFDGKKLAILCESEKGSDVLLSELPEPSLAFESFEDFNFQPERRGISPASYYAHYSDNCRAESRSFTNPYRNENLKTESSSKKMKRNRARLRDIKFFGLGLN